MKSKLKKESIFILIVTFVLTLIFLLVFGWGEANIEIYTYEPKTNLVETNSDPVYSEKNFAKTLQEYPEVNDLTLFEDIVNNDEPTIDYSDIPVMPGLKATKTLNNLSKTTEMCTSMTPQGVTIAEDYLITSAYDSHGIHNSVLYVQDINTNELIKTIVLKGKLHVGGIAYNNKSKELWVCGRRKNKAEIFSIKLEDIEKYDFNKKNKPIKYNQRVLLNNISRASYITYFEDALYVGFFNPLGKGSVKQYLLNEKGEVEGQNSIENLIDKFNILADAISSEDTLEKVQGIAFFEDYSILAQSYGPGESKLYIFNKDLNKSIYHSSDAIAEFIMPSHLEQIHENDGYLYMVFESAANKYRKSSKNKIDRIISIDLEGFIRLVLEEEVSNE